MKIYEIYMEKFPKQITKEYWDKVEFLEIKGLEKHKYPKFIVMFFCFIFIIYLYIMPKLILHEMPIHKKLNLDIQQAEKLFQEKNYTKALNKYLNIVNKHNNFKKGRIRVIECCFVLSNIESNFLIKACKLLENEKFENKDYDEISMYIPPQYIELLKSAQ